MPLETECQTQEITINSVSSKHSRKGQVNNKFFKLSPNPWSTTVSMGTMALSLHTGRPEAGRLIPWAEVRNGRKEVLFLECWVIFFNSLSLELCSINTNLMFPSSKFTIRMRMICWMKITLKIILKHGLK